MSDEKIIRKLWSVIFALLLYINGQGKPIKEIQAEIQGMEEICEKEEML